MFLKLSWENWRHLCLGLNVFNICHFCLAVIMSTDTVRWISALLSFINTLPMMNSSDRFTERVYLMMTSSNGNIFRVTGFLCGEFTGPREFPAQRPVTRRFDVFFDLLPNKRCSKQRWGWWIETPSRSLWRHCNVRLWHGLIITTMVFCGVWSLIHAV